MKPAASSSPFKRIFACALLALAMLGVQHAATLHWLSHAIDATHARSSAALPAAASDHCDACLAFSVFGSAAASGENVVEGLACAADLGVSAADADARPAASWLAFRSRAPPVLI